MLAFSSRPHPCIHVPHFEPSTGLESICTLDKYVQYVGRLTMRAKTVLNTQVADACHRLDRELVGPDGRGLVYAMIGGYG